MAFALRRLRRLAAISLLVVATSWSAALAAPEESKPHILVLLSHDAAPYRAALKGFRQALAQHGVDAIVEEVDLQQHEREASALLQKAKRERVVITLGTAATEAALAENRSLSIVAGLILNVELLGKAGNATGVVLQIPPKVQFEWMQRVLRPSAKVGVLYNPQENQQRVEEAQRAAHEDRFELLAFQVTAPQLLPSALENAVSRSDALWVIPDSLVVSPETAKTLLLASFRNRVPMIGLSSAWVKAGALFALDWDYEDVGAQCAELAIQAMAGKRPGAIPPINARRFTYAVNLKTAREMRVELSDSLISGAAQVFE